MDYFTGGDMVHKALGKLCFAFLLYLLEFNSNWGGEGGGFVGLDDVRPMLEFTRLLTRSLINNSYIMQDDMTPEKKSR